VSPKLRRLSGREVVAILGRFGFDILSQRGSHAKLRRLAPTGKQTITVPLHAELDAGTLNAIFRQACRFIPEDTLRSHFFSE
jgi:predicted RNA binding protein YcfA (HicA-like mRNA interferase family)